MYNIEEIKKDLQDTLSLRRYEHSLMVADMASSLARHYGLDQDKAYITGLVHDIAKEYSDSENNYYINNYHIDPKFLTIEYKPVLHSIIGSFVVQEKYHMDEEISLAVRYHALGNVNMDLFAKIIFIADKVGRNDLSEEMEKVRKLAYQDIDQAIVNSFNIQQRRLKEKGRLLLKESLELIKLLDKR